MRTIPQAWRQEYIKGNRKYDVTVNMTLADETTLTIENDQIWQGGFSFEQATSSDSSFDIGSAIVGSATLVLDNINEDFSEYDFFNAEFNVSLSLVETELQAITIGHYTVDETSYNGSLITLKCLDNMWRFDRPFSEITTVSYPATARDIINAMCGYSGIGIQLATQSFQGYDFSIPSAPEEDMTCREVLQYVAQATCNYCIINEQGNLELKWYDKSIISNMTDYDGGTFSTTITPYSDGDTVNGGTFAFNDGDSVDGGLFYDGNSPIAYITNNYSMSVDTDDIVVTGVKICTSDTDNEDSYDYSWHDSTLEQTHPRYTLVIQDNPFISKNTAQSLATTIGGILAGTPLRGFSSSSLNDISIEAGDPCIIVDFRGNRYYSFVTNTRFTTSNSENFSCGVESIVQNKTVRYSNEIKTLVEAKRNAQEVVSDYDQAVQRMHQLAANAGGLYWLEVPQQGGSAIWYESDMPLSLDSSGNIVFTSGSHAWKRTSNGFFSCTSTGTSEATTTWTAGIDSNNNAVMNTVSAIGINADWINAGSLNAARITAGILKDQYNYNYWNLSTGEFRLAALPANQTIYDENADYSGAYVPTNSNLPASSWTASEKASHVGETFLNTSTNKTYIYKASAGDAVVHFNSQCATEGNNYDYVDIYIPDGSSYKKVRLQGTTSTFGAKNIPVTSEFWLHWHTDVSQHDYYGWKIDNIDSSGGDSVSWTSASLPSVTWTNINYPGSTLPESEHNPYSDNVDNYYHFTVSTTGTYEWVEATLGDYIDAKASSEVEIDHDTVFNALTNNGADNGLYMVNGYLYLRGSRIGADKITIGGINYSSNPTLEIKNSSGEVIGSWTLNGIVANAGTFGKLKIFTDSSNITYLKYVASGYRYYLNESWGAGKITNANRVVRCLINPYREGWQTDAQIKVDFAMSVRNVASYKTATQCVLKLYKYTNGTKSVELTANIKYDGTGTNINTVEVYDEETGQWITTNWLDYTFDHNHGANSGDTYYITCTVEKRNATYTNNGGTTLSINDNGNGSGFVVREGTDHRAICTGRFSGEFTGDATLDTIKVGDYILCGDGEYTTSTHEGSSTYGASVNYDGVRVWHGTEDWGDSDDMVYLSYDDLRKEDGGTDYWLSWQTSDERAKEEIEDLDSDLSKRFIDSIRTRKFKYKGAEGKHYGVIAQETREILDNLGEEDSKLEYIAGKPDGKIPNQRSVHYEEFVPHLINYVKDLRSEIDSLKVEIAKIKGE